MTHALVLFLMPFLVLFCTVQGQGQCAKNEEFQNCGGCEKTCQNRNPVCSEQCQQGCFCRQGSVRNARGNCVRSKACGAQGSAVCSRPSVVGNCEAIITRWYFDSPRNRCIKFTYSGCGDNGNNFETIQQCNQRCCKNIVTCASDPCATATCAAYPDARCDEDTCGQCRPTFNYLGIDVNGQC